MAEKEASQKPGILFVCVANACRSQMAEALAKSLANGDWEIWSAGSHPGGFVHPTAKRMVEELGLDVSSHYSKGVQDVPQRKWDYVVSMGCGDSCASVEAQRHLDWPIPDPVGLPENETRHIRDKIKASICALMGKPLSDGWSVSDLYPTV